MTAVQISASQGTAYDKSASYTISTNAPGTGDFEVRYNLLNTNSVAITKLDLIKFLEGVIQGLNSGYGFFGTAVNGVADFVGPQI